MSGPFGEILKTGAPSDTTQVFQSAKELGFRNIQDQVDALKASAGPLGLRFSSDINRNEALLRERGTQDLNSIIAQIAFQAAESAAGRRLAAPNLLLGARDSALAPILNAANFQTAPRQPSNTSNILTQLAPLLGMMNFGGGGAPAGGVI